MEDESLTMFPRFRLECWQKDNHPQGSRYTIGISAEGVRHERMGAVGISRPVIAGIVLLDNCGNDFAVDAITQRPPEVTDDEARVVLLAIFQDMDFGAQYTDDLIWRPVDPHEFIQKCLPLPQWPRVYRSVLRALGERALKENGMKIKEDSCPRLK